MPTTVAAAAAATLQPPPPPGPRPLGWVAPCTLYIYADMKSLFVLDVGMWLWMCIVAFPVALDFPH